jgi:Copper chaperone PCu(A)C
MSMNNGVMTMRPLDKGLAIEPGKTVKLAPGGYHLMMMDAGPRFFTEHRALSPIDRSRPVSGHAQSRHTRRRTMTRKSASSSRKLRVRK